MASCAETSCAARGISTPAGVAPTCKPPIFEPHQDSDTHTERPVQYLSPGDSGRARYGHEHLYGCKRPPPAFAAPWPIEDRTHVLPTW